MSCNATGCNASIHTRESTETGPGEACPMKTTMFYDGECPVCMRGVRHYRRLDWAGRLAWVDLTDPQADLAAHGLEFASAMDLLHVRGRDGVMHRGGAAFAALWAELPVYRWLALGLRSTGLVGLMDRVYRRLARGRYARRCAEGVCDPTGQRVMDKP